MLSRSRAVREEISKGESIETDVKRVNINGNANMN